MGCINDDSLGILFSDVARLYWRRLEAALAAQALDFTAGEGRVLVTLAEMPDTRQAQLAERLHIEPMTLVGFLDRLAAKGMIERCCDPTDRRAKLVHLTAAAAATADRIRAVSAEVEATLVEGLDAAAVGDLRRLMRRVRDTLACACADAKGGRP